MIEIWKDIDEYDGAYQVSNFGRVRSLRDWHGNQNLRKYVYRELIMKPTENGNGYLIVFLRKDAKRKRYYVHRLVANAFIPNPNNLPVVNHIDYDKSNNNVENLEWCTQKENVNYSVERMRKRRTVFKTSTGEQYIYIRKSTGRFRIVVDGKEYSSAATLEEAIRRRDEILSKGVVA